MKRTRRQFIHGTSVLAGGVLAQPFGSSAALMAQHATAAPFVSATKRFRTLLNSGVLNQCPVVHDVISAKLCAAHGFPMILLGGGAVSQDQFGMGDFGMLTITEMIDLTARLTDAVDLPLIADGDDAGGNPLNVRRAVRMLERAGAACVLIEDLYGAKHLTGLGNGNVISSEAMVDKVHAAVDARQDANFAILVRCDAPAAEALDRVGAYCEAGGDLVMVGSIPLDQSARVIERTKRPLLVTKTAPLPELQKNKVSIVVYSGPLLNVAVGAMDRALADIKATGAVANYAQLAASSSRLGQLTNRAESVAMAKKYNALRR